MDQALFADLQVFIIHPMAEPCKYLTRSLSSRKDKMTGFYENFVTFITEKWYNIIEYSVPENDISPRPG